MAARHELHTADVETQVLTPASDRDDGPEGLAPGTYALMIGPYSGALVIEDSAARLCRFAGRLTHQLVRSLPSGPEAPSPLGPLPAPFGDLTLSALLASALTQVTTLFTFLATDDGDGLCDALASDQLTQLGTTLYAALGASPTGPSPQPEDTFADLLKAAARERAGLIDHLERGDRSDPFAYSVFATCRLDLVRLYLLRAQHVLGSAPATHDQEGHRS